MKEKLEKVKKANLKQLKAEKGITLIALVITVVILIILATVSINVVLGKGGLIQRAQEAKDLTEQATLEEQQRLNSLMDQMANIMNEEIEIPEPEEHEHNYEAGIYEANETQHWQVCTICKEKGNLANHDEVEYEYNDNEHWKTCNTCAYEYDKGTHESTTGYHSDNNYHYVQCDICGAEYDKKEHDFIWIIDKEATATESGMRHEECTICNHSRPPVSYNL